MAFKVGNNLYSLILIEAHAIGALSRKCKEVNSDNVVIKIGEYDES